MENSLQGVHMYGIPIRLSKTLLRRTRLFAFANIALLNWVNRNTLRGRTAVTLVPTLLRRRSLRRSPLQCISSKRELLYCGS
ncbi:MAG: hypothetical protein PUP91_02430 [Rhizonema sp. PD37]|nr:hypothetical protein [Rhizonema sp. PD37]